MPDKSGSNRIGFNQRGPSVKDQMDNARRLSAMNDPDSEYWENRAKQSLKFLVDCMGKSEFEEWAERVYPDDVIDSVPWKEIYEMYDGKFQREQAEIAMVDGLDWEDEPKHFKMNGGY